MPDAWTVGRALTGLGSLVVLILAGLIAGYLGLRMIQGGYTTTADLFFGGLVAALGIGALVVLVRLYRGRPAGWLAVLVLVVGLVLPAIMGLPYLLGQPFVY